MAFLRCSDNARGRGAPLEAIVGIEEVPQCLVTLHALPPTAGIVLRTFECLLLANRGHRLVPNRSACARALATRKRNLVRQYDFFAGIRSAASSRSYLAGL